MCEIKVKQKTDEWHRERGNVLLTASRFGEALGLGQGKPYDFLKWITSEDYQNDDRCSRAIEHGVQMEPVINEAYELLTGYQTKPSGFWVPNECDDRLYGLVGASPDALVFENGKCEQPVGLAEFKAPFYKMYGDGVSGLNAIPRRYMAQIQGQMAICQLPWCDFMSVCTATQEIMLKRVFFQPEYWDYVSYSLKEFCNLIKVARKCINSGLEVLAIPEAQLLKAKNMSDQPFPGERAIIVNELLSTSNNEFSPHYKSLSGVWMSYKFLLGQPCSSELEITEQI